MDLYYKHQMLKIIGITHDKSKQAPASSIHLLKKPF